MQVVMNKYFLLNPKNILTHIRLVVFVKNAKNRTFNSENTSPSYSNNQIMVSGSLKLTFNLLII